jgi:hypothetical protein
MSVIKVLALIAKKIPVEWDRYIEDDGTYNVYGWIQRSDGKRDFLLVSIKEDLGTYVSFVTSSAKYSKTLTGLIHGDTSEHIDCKKVEDLYKEDE